MIDQETKNCILKTFDLEKDKVKYLENYLYKLKHDVEYQIGHYVSMDECAETLENMGKYHVEKVVSNHYADGYTYKVNKQ